MQAKVAAIAFLKPAIFKKWEALYKLFIYTIDRFPSASESDPPTASLRSLVLTLAISGNLLLTSAQSSMTAFQVG